MTRAARSTKSRPTRSDIVYSIPVIEIHADGRIRSVGPCPPMHPPIGCVLPLEIPVKTVVARCGHCLRAFDSTVVAYLHGEFEVCKR